jgi:SAM-dependent methyltransferase
MCYEKLVRWLYEIEDLIFEKYYGFDLSGNISAANLVTSFATKENSNEYRPAFIGTLRTIFTEANKFKFKFKNFVDIGSGKGKACFYASRTQLFTQVLGIEFSKDLVDISIKNKSKSKFGVNNVELINADASNYILPNGASLIFLFNPFDQVVLEKFIQNNMNHFESQGSVIAYANDIHRDVLEKMGFEEIFRNPTRKISIHKAIPISS